MGNVVSKTVLNETVSFAKKVVNEVSEEGITFMAGSIAYQAFVSLIPLLVLVFFAVSLVGDEQLANQVVAFTEGFLPPDAAELLGKSISGETSSASASLIGLVTLVWGTLKVFRGLDTAFSEIYDTAGRNSFVDQIIDGLVMLVATGGAIVAAAAGVTAISLIPLPGDNVLVPLVLISVLIVAFYPMYARFPDLDVSRREIIPGVVVAALGWTALQAVFGYYVEFAGGMEAFSAQSSCCSHGCTSAGSSSFWARSSTPSSLAAEETLPSPKIRKPDELVEARERRFATPTL